MRNYTITLLDLERSQNVKKNIKSVADGDRYVARSIIIWQSVSIGPNCFLPIFTGMSKF